MCLTFNAKDGTITESNGKPVAYIAARMQANDKHLSLGPKLAASHDLYEELAALIAEIDNIYDVDDGIPNIAGSIMERVTAARAALSRANPTDRTEA